MNNRPLEDPRLCQHNFGGAWRASQPNRLFYFALCEGLRLAQPQSIVSSCIDSLTRAFR